MSPRKAKANLLGAVSVFVLFILFKNGQAIGEFLESAFKFLLFAGLIGIVFFAIYKIFSQNRKESQHKYILRNYNNETNTSSNKLHNNEVAGKTGKVDKKWSIELIRALEWKSFEELCAEYYTAKGYLTKLTRLGADGGVDIEVYKESYYSKPSGIIQCKAWGKNKVGVKPIRELFGVMASEQVALGIFITSGAFTQEAENFSLGKQLKLITGIRLLNLIEELPEEKQQNLLEKITKCDYLTPSCPSCGIKMVFRTSKKSKNFGRAFWGCKNFPKCRSTLQVKKVNE